MVLRSTFLFASGKISVTGTYDYSNSNTVTNTTSETWTVPSEYVIVKPGQTIRVEWLVTMGKATGTSNLDVRLEGAIPFALDENGVRIGRHMRNTFNDYDRFTKLGIISKIPDAFTPAERNLYIIREGNSVD